MKQAYQYIFILFAVTWSIIIHAQVPGEGELTGLCERIASHNFSGIEVAPRNSLVDINNDGLMEFDKSTTQGTMHVPAFRFVDVNGNEVLSEKLKLRYERYYSIEYQIIESKNFTYILHCEDRKCARPSFLQLMSLNNESSVICEFENKNKQELIGSPICDSVSGKENGVGNQLTLKYAEFANDISIDRKKWDIWSTYYGKSSLADFDNDGKLENLVEVQYDSSSGRGCSYTYFDLLTSDGASIKEGDKRNKLLNFQRVQPGSDRFSRSTVPYCTNENRHHKTGWFVLKGETYYETKFFGNSPFHLVYKLNGDGAIEEICNLKFVVETKIKSMPFFRE